MVTLSIICSLALGQAQAKTNPNLDPGGLVSATTHYAPNPAPFKSSCDRAEDNTWRGGYGCHAIEWKALKAAAWFNSFQNMCFGVDVFLHAPNPYCLDMNEASGAVFPYGDPAGGWQSAQASTANELLAGAVLAMKRWETPVYAVLSIGGVLKTVAFDEIRVTSLLPLDVRCGWLGWSAVASLDEVDHKCALFELRDLSKVSVDLVYWDATLGRVDVTYTGDQVATAFADAVQSLEPSGQRVPKYGYAFNVP
ncbi:MAG: hypothetical protein IPJ65_16150 [Archangiaceae bacterium]|nr:hypothetical protein [Archangiaceae bacterium]